MHVGDSVLTEVESEMVFISVHLVYQASRGPLSTKQFPSCTAVGISAHGCLWLIIRMCHSLFFVPSPYFIYLPSPGPSEKRRIVMEKVTTTNLSSPNSRCPSVTSSYRGAKQQLMEIIMIKMNVYAQLTLDVPPPQQKILES